MLEPPQRGSMWRFGFDVPPNYNDMSNYCGGKDNQWTVQHGRCGVCGDPFQGPREHENGGIYATGIIGRTYESGTTINTTIDITANHFGYFEFRLCPLDMGHSRRTRRLTQQCLDQYLLKMGPSDSKSNGDDTRYYLPHGNKSYFYVPVELPSEILSCQHCVLQWKYHAGNTWGKDQQGRKCLGCADQQEEFYNCADIAIVERSSSEPVTQISDKRNPALDLQVQQWIETVLEEKFPDVPYEDAIKDGIILCKLMNKLQPNSIPKYATSGGSFQFRENIALFQNAARAYGLGDAQLFQTIDLFEKRNIPQVTLCLFVLRRLAQKKKLNGSTFSPRVSEADAREFSDEQLNTAKNGLPLLHEGTNKDANQSG
ncbi:unnamed protein product [Rotaria magnacalcarata]|uniref:Calponin-homology (CH) domain-containing protein n=5 Tax=Rotaria magnacalcarata TaxID=392030 RepID=A0A819QUJ3_9BILA|nr:unnamed protein product [Rotaria magnacalcarata]